MVHRTNPFSELYESVNVIFSKRISSSYSCSSSSVLSFEGSAVPDVGSEDVPAKFSSIEKVNVSKSAKKLEGWIIKISVIVDTYDLQ